MKILPVHGNKGKYSSNVYLLLGEWNRLEDINTLVDVVSDESVIKAI